MGLDRVILLAIQLLLMMKINDSRFRETSDSLRTKALKHSLLSCSFPFNFTSIPSDILNPDACTLYVYCSLAVSLGEAIARKAATADIMTQDDSCQTSPVLLQSLKRSLDNRVERATNPHSVWRKPQPSKPGQLFEVFTATEDHY